VDKRQPIRLSVRLREDAPGISPFITSIITISISLRDDDSLCMQIDKLTRNEFYRGRETSLSRTKDERRVYLATRTNERTERTFRTCEFYEFASFRTNALFERSFRVFKSLRRIFQAYETSRRTFQADIKSHDEFQALKDELRAVYQALRRVFKSFRALTRTALSFWTSCTSYYDSSRALKGCKQLLRANVEWN